MHSLNAQKNWRAAAWAVAAGVILALQPATAQAACVVDPVTGTTGTQCSNLLAGQFTDAGDVCATVVGEDLVVTYTTQDGWELEQAHLWVGTGLATMPQTRKGNPIPGQFPHHSGDIAGATQWTFTIPLSSLGMFCPGPDQALWVAAHAALRKDNGNGTYQTQTGWGNGNPIVDRGSWATAFQITLTCNCGDTDPEPDPTCETAFAYSPSGTCFLGLDVIEAKRWGWTIPLPGQGRYTFDVYAGAGQCSLNKGTLVGTLTVVYQGTTATVTFGTANGFTMDVAHLYVGEEILPRVNGFPEEDYTVAPGQYPYNSGELDSYTSYTFTVEGLSGGPVYVVAHAEVCGQYGD